MKQYRVFDHDIGDYVSPYDEDKEYWTLEEAQDLAYRKQEDWCANEDPEFKKEAYDCLAEIGKMTGEDEISDALDRFGYELERVEETDHAAQE